MTTQEDRMKTHQMIQDAETFICIVRVQDPTVKTGYRIGCLRGGNRDLIVPTFAEGYHNMTDLFPQLPDAINKLALLKP